MRACCAETSVMLSLERPAPSESPLPRRSIFLRYTGLAAALVALVHPVRANPGTAPPLYRVGAELLANKPGELTVLTYNIAGLPWPVRADAERLDSIAERLRQLRRLGAQPQVMVLQEAFTDEARAVGGAAGYRYAAFGPSADAPRPQPVRPLDPAFVGDRLWLRGEKGRPWLPSGLAIFSDYPIVATLRRPFPEHACAGFDCTANKGVLVASIRVPGAAEPIDIGTTHLNSRLSSHAPIPRTLVAYRAQLAALDGVLGAAPARAGIVVGDFNVHSIQRYEALNEHSRRWQFMPATAMSVIRSRLRCGGSFGPCGTDLPIPSNIPLARAADWQFFRQGEAVALWPVRRVRIFGPEDDGTMMSDHYGYSVTYKIEPRTRAQALKLSRSPGSSQRILIKVPAPERVI
jgi:endonuclease/exonuclease/phosphatase family metal-dependent hydrolase